MVLCKACGFSNIERDHFCGKCGQALQPVPEPVTVEKAAKADSSGAATTETVATPKVQPIAQSATPAFDFSLSPETETISSSSYLLEDEPPPRTHGFAWFLLVLAILLFLGAAAFVGYQKYYFVPPLATAAPVPGVPGFAFDRTPPMLQADTQLSAMTSEPTLPTRNLADQLALANISTTMRNIKAQDEQAQSNSPEAEGARLLADGEKYLYGRGVPSNCEYAVKKFKASADKGNAAAMAHLGALYGSGHCVKFSRLHAYQWFAKAQNANPSNTWYQASMDMLWRNMSRHERSALLK